MRISDWSSDVCSSDLSQPIGAGGHGVGSAYRRRTGRCRRFAIYRSRHPGLGSRDRDSQRHLPGGKKAQTERSEEHTSELPVTNAHLVCRLLLEKKKTKETKPGNKPNE